ncbi:MULTISPECIES: ester cyclase [Bacillus cereus group]|uniref:Polyketide cyclase n=1 Tax=Bacillus cereus TaxID=1396 RepID=A0A2C1MB19_BACCE|nr:MULTISPECIES: ester cyclase [Bacillus cereus group]MDR4984046.1 ester cyclase [Bacillus cereus]MEA1011675.1 ester cyclase [Bacillus cereus]PES96729.1 polyketide cyclase [Bacillus cereus]PFP72867.1 polyketide cyclase [Bacillus cereus]PGU07309.1 polyketide cyclase [Bacillus cereus]
MTPEQIVRKFFEEVRSGNNPDYSNQFMAEKVLAHQIVSEEEQTVCRTPEDYAEHVREMIEVYGNFSLEIQEFLVQESKVYVRWKQVGMHVGEIDGYQPTGLPIIQIASAVYRIEDGKIVEYWIQIDRSGIQNQLERNKNMQ